MKNSGAELQGIPAGRIKNPGSIVPFAGAKPQGILMFVKQQNLRFCT